MGSPDSDSIAMLDHRECERAHSRRDRRCDGRVFTGVRTTRVQKAKRLLDETKLPMAEVAAGAGFASLRCFNAVFAEIYERTPTQIRFKPV